MLIYSFRYQRPLFHELRQATLEQECNHLILNSSSKLAALHANTLALLIQHHGEELALLLHLLRCHQGHKRY